MFELGIIVFRILYLGILTLEYKSFLGVNLVFCMNIDEAQNDGCLVFVRMVISKSGAIENPLSKG